MKKTIYLLLLLMTMISCHDKSLTERMTEIDSLVIQEQYDSAYASVMRIDGSELITREDSAHYYLLLTQTSLLTFHPDTVNMHDSLVIPYYNKVENHEKLADAYYYKAYEIYKQRDYPEAIRWFKKAEEQAFMTNKLRLQYKIVEYLSHINGVVGNYIMQLDYAQKALKIAKSAQNDEWTAYALSRISHSYSWLGHKDSAVIYINKTIPLIKRVREKDQPTFLTNAAYVFKYTIPDSAKKYLIMSLEQEESSVTMQHLADIYYIEGKKEEAYHLWKKALTVNDGIPKDNILHNILDYDMDHGHTDQICETVNEIIHIKDSMLNSLRNDTIKDLQLRFDHEVAMREADKKLLSTQRLLMGSAIILVLMAFYIFYRKKKEEAREQDYQDQLYAYTTEIDQLTANKDKALAHISELESSKDENLQKISQLEAEAKDAETAIKKLNQNIKKLLNEEAPKLKEGKMLYDQIMEGQTALYWTHKDEEYFNKYYAATHYQSFNRLRKVKRVTKLSAHNLFYLILKDMGKSDDEVRRIMALSPEGLRSIRNRTKPLSPEDLSLQPDNVR